MNGAGMYNEAGLKEARTANSIHPAIGELEDGVAQIVKLVTELEDRLAPVMKGDIAKEPTVGTQAFISAASPVATAIQHQNAFIHQLALRLSKIHSRLDI